MSNPASQTSNLNPPPPSFDTVTSLTFDVFGTVTDWEGSVTKGLAELYTRECTARGAVVGNVGDEELRALTRKWRAGYARSTRETAQTQSGTLNVDVMHRQLLNEILAQPSNAHLAQIFGSDEVSHELTMLWHKLNGWPDATNGLNALKKRYTLATLSNGNVRLLIDLAKHSNLPFDAILSAELLGAYKPNPQIYTLASQYLRPASTSTSATASTSSHSHLAHVAAHILDLTAFRRACPGVRTVYVRRPTEEPDVQEKVNERRGGGDGEYGEYEVDIVVDGFEELAKRLGLTGGE